MENNIQILREFAIDQLIDVPKHMMFSKKKEMKDYFMLERGETTHFFAKSPETTHFIGESSRNQP